MPDTEYLRQAMHTETADLQIDIPIDRIRRRAHGLRTLRTTALAAGFAVLVLAVALPGFAFFGQLSTIDQQAGGPPTASQSGCPTPTAGPTGKPALLDSFVETGTSIEGPDQRQLAVLLTLIGQRDDPMFSIAFQDGLTGDVVPWDTTEVSPGPEGGFKAKGNTYHFYSSQLVLGPGRVLDVGIYGGLAHRITVASEGRSSEAHTFQSAATGWTLFWVERDAKPLPDDANAGPQESTGPERLTITAFNAAGGTQHTVTGGHHTGHRIQNPRDNAPAPGATPTPGLPCS